MTPVQAAQVSLNEYVLRSQGHARLLREDWERTRWHAWTEVQVAPFIKAQNKPRTPIDLLPLDGEKTTQQSITPDMCHITSEEQERLVSIMEKFIAKRKR